MNETFLSKNFCIISKGLISVGIAPVCNGWMNTYKVQAYEAIFLWPRTILIPNQFLDQKPIEPLKTKETTSYYNNDAIKIRFNSHVELKKFSGLLNSKETKETIALTKIVPYM